MTEASASNEMLVMPAPLIVETAESSYPIYVGENCFANSELLLPHLRGKQVFIVTQENIAASRLPYLQAVLSAYQCDVLFLPNGEEHKNLQQWQQILDQLLAKHHERTTTVIALGGGVVGDITGFAAACYLRGVDYIQIPTTLIAQVDSSIGGKTAVNHLSAKNMIGAFHPPKCVITDIAMLQTLSQREYMAGLAEVIKYGLIHDVGFFDWLVLNMDALLARDKAAQLHAIKESIRIKVHYVTKDEKEQGIRSHLNFGHTFGHALEAANHYQEILHGEAIAIGMSMAAHLSHQLGLLSQEDNQRVQGLLQKILNLKALPPLPSPEEMLNYMQHDKKVASGKIHFILLKAIGKAFKTVDVTKEELIKVLAQA